jgi:hypothetical protein
VSVALYLRVKVFRFLGFPVFRFFDFLYLRFKIFRFSGKTEKTEKMKKTGFFCKVLWGKTGKPCRVSTENRKTGKPKNLKTGKPENLDA